MRRAFFAILLGITIIAGAIGAFRWARLRRIDSQKASIPAATDTTQFRSVPPFSTKEPERYQATRIMSWVENKYTTDQPPSTNISKILIARDGDKRREEYESSSGEALVYLETPEGRFILCPARKLYADLNHDIPPPASNGEAGVDSNPQAPDFSPERLLNEKPALAHYEKVGTETINKRAATRYRVTPRGPTTSNDTGSVTLIWIDDALGLPIRSETSSTLGDHPAKVIMQLSELKDTVDPRVFELPKDYRKVDYHRFLVESAQTSALPGAAKATPDMP